MKGSGWYSRVALLAACALLGTLAWLRSVQSFTNEFNYARCVTMLNCANCLLTWANDAGCASGKACIAFALGSGPAGFQACTATGVSTDQCNTGYMPYPAVFCSNGQWQWCACRSLTTGDCPPMVDCNCNWSVPTGTGSFLITTTACYN